MSASSGYKGTYAVYSHPNNEHNFHMCLGRSKKKVSKGKYTYQQCKNVWSICQRGGHDFAGERKDVYMVCRSCEDHPGGGLDGTGLDGTYYTPGSGGSGGSGQGQDVQYYWDSSSNRYYYVDSNGATQWADGGQSSR